MRQHPWQIAIISVVTVVVLATAFFTSLSDSFGLPNFFRNGVDGFRHGWVEGKPYRVEGKEVAKSTSISPAIDSFNLKEKAGEITVVGSNSAVITAKAVLQAYSWKDNAAAQAYLERCNINLRSTGHSVEAVIVTPGNSDYIVTADWTLTVPQRLAEEIEADLGKLAVTDITGDLNVTSHLGEISLRHISQATAHSDAGAIHVVEANGRLDLSCNMGEVTANDIQAATIENKMGSVRVDGATGDLDLNSNAGSVEVRNAGGAVTAHSNMGAVTCRLTDSAKRPIDLTSNMGAVEVYLPAGFPASIEAHTNMGEINSNIDQLNTEGMVNKKAAGTINGGGVRVYLSTNMGQVRVDASGVGNT